ncbi:hypothetical protein JCM10449v2_000934 [Rhodotorula kratochvilovae]
MDSDNPWGAPSTPSSPHLDPTSPPPEHKQRASFEADADVDTPAWDSASPAAPEKEVEQNEALVTVADEDVAAVEEAEPETEGGGAGSDMDVESGQEDAPTGASSDDDSAPSRPSTPPPAQTASPEPAPPASPSSPAVPSPAPTFPAAFPEPLPNEAPPMDDFDEPAPSASSFADDAFDTPAEGGADDFDDFGSVGEAGDDDDFGDFGDFGDAAPLDEAAFAAPAAPAPVPAPVASAYPPLRLDLRSTARRAVAPQLRDFWAEAWPASALAVSDEPERQVEGSAQVLVTESSRNLLTNLSTLSPLKPLDWRRSRIRREHLISMGIPVNLDEASEPKISTLSLSASLHAPSRPSSAPPLAGTPLPFAAASPGGSRPSTPYGTLRAAASRSRTTLAPPPFDRVRADELLALQEDDLTLLSLQRLKEVGEELERISVEASGVLTHALMTREKEGQDKEVYNGMIQDLVVAAAKMKTSSPSGVGQAPKRQGSGRWKLSSSVK